MNARYWQRGETLDYTAEDAVANGQVVSLGNRIGVAGNDIAEGATGALHVTGVYIMDKKASEKITMGAPVYYDTDEELSSALRNGGGQRRHRAGEHWGPGRRTGSPQQSGHERRGRKGVRHYRGHRRNAESHRAGIRRA